MSEHKKTHPTAATVEQVEGGAGFDGSSVSTSKHTTSPPLGQVARIADFLGYGQSSAILLRHLKELAGLPGREVRRMIQAERLRGVPILSDNVGGYFLPADEDEKERFVKSMQHRADEILKSAAAISKGGR